MAERKGFEPLRQFPDDRISSVIASRYLAVFYEKIREPEIPRHRRIDRAF